MFSVDSRFLFSTRSPQLSFNTVCAFPEIEYRTESSPAKKNQSESSDVRDADGHLVDRCSRRARLFVSFLALSPDAVKKHKHASNEMSSERPRVSNPAPLVGVGGAFAGKKK